MLDYIEFIKAGKVKIKSRILIMGIVNCTPDSFSDGGRFFALDKAVAHVKKLIAEGADIIDIGGESTRPGANPVSLNDELDRVIPLLKEIRSFTNIPISIDTYKHEVAEAALEEGADIINDISSCRKLNNDGLYINSPEMVEVVKKYSAHIVLMHMQGQPKNMQDNIKYQNTTLDVKDFLIQRLNYVQSFGVDKSKIWLDPGFGFGKKFEDNIELIKNLGCISELGCKILVGLSRKKMLEKILNLPVEKRVEGSITLAVLAAERGANVVRVHDVLETARAIRVAEKIIFS